jgi:predicted metalloprotease with PDZ domain
VQARATPSFLPCRWWSTKRKPRGESLLCNIQVRPGTLALAYPRWIPGEHGPTGPIQQFAALRIRSGNATLPGTRDPEDIQSIHVEVPPNTDRITVYFDTLLENTISDHQLLVAWNTVVLYPRDVDKRQLLIEPSIPLPSNWQQANALRVTSHTDNRVDFAPLSLERLIDSPVLADDSFAWCHWLRSKPWANDRQTLHDPMVGRENVCRSMDRTALSSGSALPDSLT